MEQLDLDSLAALVRTGSVHRVFIMPYPEIDGGGWYLDIDHKDTGMTRDFRTKRGTLRVFKTLEMVVKQLRECGYGGQTSLVLRPEQGGK